MLTVAQAFDRVIREVHPLRDQEQVSIPAALGRILASAVRGSADVPAWDNSAMDGYAIAAADLHGESDTTPQLLQVVMEIPAGVAPDRSLASGQAARIFTGAMLPQGADTIVMQEDTQRTGNQVQILRRPQPGAFVRRRGSYYQAGSPLLEAGIKLGPADLAVLATVQCCDVPVLRQPRVALVSTGNELVAPEQPLQPGQIVDSNRYILSALVQESGAIAQHFQTVGDQLSEVTETIAEALAAADIVISTGGVSVGDYDYVDQALQRLGGKLHFQSVAMKPGKPLTFATFEFDQAQRPVLFFGLPGNPVSAPVGFWRFVQPALRKCAGLKQGVGPDFVQAIALESLASGGGRETYVWGHLDWDRGHYQFRPAPGHQISGNLINLAQTNALGVLSCDRPQIRAGESMTVMRI
ncbi:molybdopterin molybdotransferase MoeA [Lyngbya confervoides]|uniref:Molybdopterin molybdenumtransferase n=1 Tax=Lyngbya confervoides BDU141951 TaxID=1574623 RepID=A0ABD4T9B3_9CYAN|nr:gephyrin-like molybdotransferase Glp [Lyngbya confervoides]MCM1985206.1 molybdopterin molybdotransferase MoeA [Lyngbya confervoides BDU141951]